MKRCLFIGIILSLALFETGCKKEDAPAACGPVPTENQMRWQEMEYYAFIHFSLNTYTDQSLCGKQKNLRLFRLAT